MYEVKLDKKEEDLDPNSRMIKKITLIFVATVIYGIVLKIVFF